MAIVFPMICDTCGKRAEYLYRLKRLLQDEHNATGLLFTDGKITEEEWLVFKDNWRLRNTVVIDAILCARLAMEESTVWDSEVDTEIDVSAMVINFPGARG